MYVLEDYLNIKVISLFKKFIVGVCVKFRYKVVKKKWKVNWELLIFWVVIMVLICCIGWFGFKNKIYEIMKYNINFKKFKRK